MRKALLSGSALVGVALLMNSAAGAATYIPVVPPPGAASVTVFDINDSNIIAGSFNDSAGVEHGFFGPLDGSNYTVLDIPEGTTGTEPRGIGNDGSITGLAKGSGFVIAQEFFRHPDGSYTILHNPYRTFDGVAQGIDDQDGFVGDFYGDLGVRVGYKGIDGQYKHRIKLPIVRTSTNPRDHSNNGLLGGGYNDQNNVQHAFAINNRQFKSYDYPDSGVQYTVIEGVNDKGQASGLWADSASNRHGFVLDIATDTWTLIDGGDGSTFQQVWGINNAGLVAVNTQQSGGYVSYIYCPKSKNQCPSGGAAVKVHEVRTANSLHSGKGVRMGRNGPKPRLPGSIL